MPAQQGVMSMYQLMAHNHSGVGQGGLVSHLVLNNVPHIDARRFGAVAGGANQHIPINAAIAEAVTQGIRKVIIPSGSFGCAGFITLSDYVELLGIGDDSLLNFASGGLVITGDFARIKRLEIRGASTDSAININGGNHWHLENLRVHDFGGLGLRIFQGFAGLAKKVIFASCDQVYITGDANNHIEFDHCAFNNSLSYGVNIEGQATQILFDHCQFENNVGEALLIRDDCYVINVLKCYFEHNDDNFDIRIGQTGMTSCRVINVEKSYFVSTGGHASTIELQGDLENININKNYFYTEGAIPLAVRYTDIGTYRDLVANKNWIGGGFVNDYSPEILDGDMRSAGTPTELTIVGGIITVDKPYHRIDGEGDAADNLVTIMGGHDGMVLVLQAENNARAITVKHGTGNIQLNAGADKPLGTTEAKLMLIYDDVTNMWCQIGHSTN